MYVMTMKVKTRLGYDGPCKGKGQPRGLGTTDHWGSEVRVENLDQGNGEERVGKA